MHNHYALSKGFCDCILPTLANWQEKAKNMGLLKDVQNVAKTLAGESENGRFVAHRMPAVLAQELAIKNRDDVLGFDQIAGVADEDMQLFYNFLFEIQHAGEEVPHKFGGILLHGPAGVGKTTLSNALVKEAGDAAVFVDTNSLAIEEREDPNDGTLLLAHIIAAADEAAVDDRTMRRKRPRKVVAILEEADRLFYNEDGTPNTRKAAEFKSAWDALKTRENVFVIMTTNIPHAIPPEIRNRLKDVGISLPKTRGQLADLISYFIYYFSEKQGEKLFDEELLDLVYASNESHEKMTEYWRKHPKAEIRKDAGLDKRMFAYKDDLEKLIRLLEPAFTAAEGLGPRDIEMAIADLVQRRHVEMTRGELKTQAGARYNDQPINVLDIRAALSARKLGEKRIKQQGLRDGGSRR